MVALGCTIQVVIALLAAVSEHLLGASQIRVVAASVGALSIYLAAMGMLVLLRTSWLLKSTGPDERRSLVAHLSVTPEGRFLLQNTRNNVIGGASGVTWAAFLWWTEPGLLTATAALFGSVGIAYIAFLGMLFVVDRVSA